MSFWPILMWVGCSWVGEASASEIRVRASFRQQAEWCGQLGSPFMARLMAGLGEALDRSTRTGARVLDWQGRPDAEGDAVPIRLAGALHDLARRGGDAELVNVYPPHDLPKTNALSGAAMAAIARHDDRVLPWLDLHPQTNEVARSGVLYPGLMTVAAETGLPLELYEIGASAGLNLMMDHFAYDLRGEPFGRAGSGVSLSPEWTGPMPGRDTVRIVGRRGCDRRPVDLSDDESCARLLAYVWPDQPERLARVAAAIEIGRAGLPRVDASDAADWVQAVLPAKGEAGVCRVLFHSIAFQYFPAAVKERIVRHLQALGRAARSDAPFAWLSFELHGEAEPRLTLRLWPGGDEQVLAHADAHVRRVRWL